MADMSLKFEAGVVRSLALCILAGLLAASPDQAAAQMAQAALPNGASSLQETYQDWRVACTAEAQATQCNLSQEQRQQDGRRILAIEIAPAGSGGANGTLVLPFGLQLDAGVTLMVDDKPIGKAFRFSTCLQAGCIVPLALDGTTARTLRSGETLKVNATVHGSGASLSFSISLKGLAAGIDRMATLLN